MAKLAEQKVAPMTASTDAAVIEARQKLAMLEDKLRTAQVALLDIGPMDMENSPASRILNGENVSDVLSDSADLRRQVDLFSMAVDMQNSIVKNAEAAAVNKIVAAMRPGYVQKTKAILQAAELLRDTFAEQEKYRGILAAAGVDCFLAGMPSHAVGFVLNAGLGNGSRLNLFIGELKKAVR